MPKKTEFYTTDEADSNATAKMKAILHILGGRQLIVDELPWRPFVQPPSPHRRVRLVTAIKSEDTGAQAILLSEARFAGGKAQFPRDPRYIPLLAYTDDEWAAAITGMRLDSFGERSDSGIIQGGMPSAEEPAARFVMKVDSEHVITPRLNRVGQQASALIVPRVVLPPQA